MNESTELNTEIGQIRVSVESGRQKLGDL